MKLQCTTSINPILNEVDTLLFIDQLKQACLAFNYYRIEKVLKDFLTKETIDNYKDFLERAKVFTTVFKNSQLDLNVIETRYFDTKCTFCFFGENVQGFELLYSLKIKPPMIVYKHEMAIHFHIKNNCLIEFNWCNRYLNRKEMIEVAKEV